MAYFDYIDFDEGRDFPEVEEPVCEGCGDRVPSLTRQSDWQLNVCPACLADRESQLVEERLNDEWRIGREIERSDRNGRAA